MKQINEFHTEMHLELIGNGRVSCNIVNQRSDLNYHYKQTNSNYL